MSSDDKVVHPVDPEKSGDMDRCTEQDDVSRDHPIPQGPGFRINLDRTKPVFIKANELESVLRDLKGPVVLFSVVGQTTYFVQKTTYFIGAGPDELGGSSDCPCPEGCFFAESGCICTYNQQDGRCYCTLQGNPYCDFPCPPQG
jgi:hypothetical protein